MSRSLTGATSLGVSPVWLPVLLVALQKGEAMRMVRDSAIALACGVALSMATAAQAADPKSSGAAELPAVLKNAQYVALTDAEMDSVRGELSWNTVQKWATIVTYGAWTLLRFINGDLELVPTNQLSQYSIISVNGQYIVVPKSSSYSAR